LNKGFASRGCDESKDSKNKGYFPKLVNTLANQNDDIRKVVPGEIEAAPKVKNYYLY
jgi:hypothetical protein